MEVTKPKDVVAAACAHSACCSLQCRCVTGEPGRRENPVAEGGEVGQRLALGGKIEWGEKWSRALVGDDDFLQRVM